MLHEVTDVCGARFVAPAAGPNRPFELADHSFLVEEALTTPATC